MLNLLKTLCDLNGVASFEDEVRTYLQREAGPYVDQMRVDALGNLILFKRGKQSAPNRLMLTAHMDEAGLIVHSITEEGYLKFVPVGPLDSKVVIGKRVSVGWNHIPGIVGLKAYHLVSEEEEKRVPKLSEMYIDIGARKKEEAEALVSRGDYIAFGGKAEEFSSGLLKAKALDSRVGCAVLLKLLEEDLPIDCTFAFTVQEGVGLRGAFGAAFSVAPEIAVVVEGTSASDFPGAAQRKNPVRLGHGPVLAVMDQGTIYDRSLFEMIRDIAVENNIPWQLKYAAGNQNDASSLQRTKAGVRVAAIGAPVRYPKAPSGLVSAADFDRTYLLTKKTVEAVAAL